MAEALKIPAGRAVVQFGAKWCGPCSAIRPTVEDLAKVNGAEFLYVDIEQQVDLANEHCIRNLPTVIAFKDGQEIGRTTGAAQGQLKTVINNSFGK